MNVQSSLLPATTLLLAATMLAAPVSAQDGTGLDETWLEAFEWRSIGPANMAGRVTDVEGIPSPSKTFYVAAAASRQGRPASSRSAPPRAPRSAVA